MKGWQKLLLRAGVVSGISTISLLIKEGFPPTYETGYFACLTFILGILVFIRTAWDNDDEDGDGIPDTRIVKQSKIREQFDKCKKKKMKSLLTYIPNLWFP